jgi:hypothetical protein
MHIKWQAATTFLWLLAASVSVAAQPGPPVPLLAPAALQEDLRFLRAAIDTTHPAPDLFASAETLRKAYEHVTAQLQQPLTRDQSWRALASLNPVFADGHMFVVYPDWREEARAHVAAGGTLFPYEVQVDVAGAMTIRTGLGGVASPLAGVGIASINGKPAAQVGRELLALMGGETPALRAHLLSRRMWFYYWKAYGAPRQFDLVLARPEGAVTLRVAGSATFPAAPSFDQTFRFTLLPDKAALLTIDQFQWADKPAFYAFTKDVFARIRAAGVTTLIIDIRENSGGDDDMWKTGLLPYIADKPFRNASSYVKKVIAGRQSGLEKVGDVVHGFGDTWVAPDLANPLFFSGQTYVLVGRVTYSSAVLFSNVMQDFGFGQLAGAGGYARTRQTGGVQNVILPNTGLEITIPRFVVDRPSGAREPALVHPDIVLPDSPFDRMVTVNALLARVRGGSVPSSTAPGPNRAPTSSAR